MWCTICNQEYIGETERPVHVRFAEHYRDERARVAKSAWGSHYRPHHKDTPAMNFQPFTKTSIIARERSVVNRKILESMHIRDRDPQVNIDGGWRLVAKV